VQGSSSEPVEDICWRLPHISFKHHAALPACPHATSFSLLPCRYLRPGDSLPIGAAPEGLKPLALPEGWREKYAGAAMLHYCVLLYLRYCILLHCLYVVCVLHCFSLPLLKQAHTRVYRWLQRTIKKCC
jgi:hypothetical protein